MIEANRQQLVLAEQAGNAELAAEITQAQQELQQQLDHLRRIERQETAEAALENIQAYIRVIDLKIALNHIALLQTRNENERSNLFSETANLIREVRALNLMAAPRRFNLSGITVSIDNYVQHDDFSYIDFSNSVLSNLRSGTNLDYCNLNGVRFVNLDMNRLHLAGANLEGADFRNITSRDIGTTPQQFVDVLGLQYLRPFTRESIDNKLTAFYRDQCENRLTELGYIRILIAIELAQAISSNPVLSDQDKLEMLKEFERHPVFEHANRASMILNQTNRLFTGGGQRTASHEQRIIQEAIAVISENIEERQNLNP